MMIQIVQSEPKKEEVATLKDLEIYMIEHVGSSGQFG